MGVHVPKPPVITRHTPQWGLQTNFDHLWSLNVHLNSSTIVCVCVFASIEMLSRRTGFDPVTACLANQHPVTNLPRRVLVTYIVNAQKENSGLYAALSFHTTNTCELVNVDGVS